MKHLFVSYEIALILKKLGFDEPCLAYYRDCRICGVNKWNRKDWEFHVISLKEITNTTNEILLAPTYQQVVDWLRERGIRVYEVYQFNTWSVTEQIKTEEFAHYGWQYTLNEAIEEALKHL